MTISNSFLGNLKENTNLGYTENGAVKNLSSLNKVLDMFAFGGAYRNRTENDIITLFKSALEEDETLALRCLFYNRDITDGQGERRFFRTCFKWLANELPQTALRNMKYIPMYGRWDDLYCLVDTPLEKNAFNFMKEQLAADILSLESSEKQGVSLLGKWLKSCNASSAETKRLGNKTRLAFGMSQKEYRKILGELRQRINIVERLMSENRWDEIEFDKIPSRAGIIYKNAFARRDIIAQKYEAFAKDKSTTVNAAALYPYDVAHRAFCAYNKSYTDPDRLMLQKYWENLPDFYEGREENGLAVVDTSGSMSGAPLEAAVSLGAYVAERGHGPFANHFITFSSKPELIEFKGVDITDKLNRCARASWEMNTNLEAVFDLLLETALKNNTPQSELPESLYLFSDMEFDGCMIHNNSVKKLSWWGNYSYMDRKEVDTLIETIGKKWASYGYKLPRIIFWNLDSRSENIPAIGDGFSYVSGLSPVIIKTILSGKDGIDLMLEKLNSERYAVIK